MLIENARAFRELEIQQLEHSKILTSHDAQLKALGAHEDYRSIKSHARHLGIKITTQKSGELGKIATALSKRLGYATGKQPDETYATVNTYHRDVLDIVFTEAGLLPKETP
jgi:hypothetical protein